MRSTDLLFMPLCHSFFNKYCNFVVTAMDYTRFFSFPVFLCSSLSPGRPLPPLSRAASYFSRWWSSCCQPRLDRRQACRHLRQTDWEKQGWATESKILPLHTLTPALGDKLAVCQCFSKPPPPPTTPRPLLGVGLKVSCDFLPVVLTLGSRCLGVRVLFIKHNLKISVSLTLSLLT